MKKIFITLCVFVLCSCATNWKPWYQNASSGQIGCAPKDIIIQDETGSDGNYTWTAICDGIKHYCSITTAGFYKTTQVYMKCTPAKK
jgi:hypothetical protein